MASLELMTPEEFYLEAEDDRATQERAEHDARIARLDPDAVVAIVIDRLKHDDRRLREFVHDMLAEPYDAPPFASMSTPLAQHIGDQLAQWAAQAADDLAGQRAACTECER